MTIAAISAAVQVRYGSQMLIELTNSSGTATTVLTTVLEAACADATGEFERIVGVTYDTGNASHLAILVRGAVYFLEFYKARDAGFVKSRGQDFYGALTNLRKAAYVGPKSNSNLTYTRERSGSKPDMDRNRTMWGGSTSATYTETIEP